MAGYFYIKSFGCKVNQCDGDELARELVSLGLDRTDDPAEAQLCIVNGCTVTATADAKCMKLLRSFRRANPEAHTVITGCTAVRTDDALAGRTSADIVIPCTDTASWREVADSIPEPAHTDTRYAAPVGRTRGFIKIQDGCDAFCSYCIVPFVRGAPRSMPRDRIFGDIDRAVARDCKEIVLTGTRLGRYGEDLDGRHSLATLIEEIDRTYNVPRIRLSSIELNEVTDELLDTFSRVEALQHHVHIPLQSGDADVLRMMNRQYRPDEFLAVVDRLRGIWPDVGVTTDVLVGFPGETESAFANTVRVVEKAGFSRLHVFRFSARPGTRASTMQGRVSSGDLRTRSRHMIELGNRLASEFASRRTGSTVDVLVESRRDRHSGHLTGLTGNYLTAVLPGTTSDMINCIVPVTVRETNGPSLICE